MAGNPLHHSASQADMHFFLAMSLSALFIMFIASQSAKGLPPFRTFLSHAAHTLLWLGLVSFFAGIFLPANADPVSGDPFFVPTMFFLGIIIWILSRLPIFGAKKKYMS